VILYIKYTRVRANDFTAHDYPEALVEVARTKMSLRRQLTHEEAQMAILMVLHKSTVIEADVAVILKNLRAD
jgi:hypothetical protein